MKSVDRYIVQILDEQADKNFVLEKLEWVEEFEPELEKYYYDTELISWELLYGTNIIDLYADLYIRPISMLEIQVGFQAYNWSLQSKVSLDSPIHWLTVKDESNPRSDVFSKFLILLLGFTCMPCATGYYNTSIIELYLVLLHGRNGKIINTNTPPASIFRKGLSGIAWVNFKGKFMDAFGSTCEAMLTFMQSDENLYFVNPTIHKKLKETHLALIITD